MAQVALAWVARRPGVSSVLVGASGPGQLAENIASVDIELTPGQEAALDAVSAPPMLNPYSIFSLPRERIFGGQDVRPWTARG